MPISLPTKSDLLAGSTAGKFNTAIGQVFDFIAQYLPSDGSKPSAVNITNTPAGNITSTDVQNAIYELDCKNQGRNRLINGDMRVSQVNGDNAVVITAGAAKVYPIDMWYSYCTGSNVTAQRVISGVNGQRYKMQYTGASGNTSILHGQRIEAKNCYDLAGSICTLQVQLANSLLTTVTWTAYYANTEDSFGTIASPTRTQIATGTFTITPTETIYSSQITIPSAATTGIEIVFSVANQTSGTWSITGIQLGKGSVATPVEVLDYGDQLRRCRRYRRPMPAISSGQAFSATQAGYATPLDSPMRTTPTLSTTSGFTTTTATGSNSSITPSISSMNDTTLYVSASGATGLVGGNATLLFHSGCFLFADL